MANKPTPEELKEKEEEAKKLAEELEGRQSIPEDESEEDENKESDPEVEVSSEMENEQEDEASEEEPREEQADPSKEFYKKRYKESASGAQKLGAGNRVINQALIEAEGLPEPTEEELTTAYPDWDLMSDVEKGLAKETIISRNWRKVIAEAKDKVTKIEKWSESVSEFINDPKILNENPELEGKEEEFSEFATQESNNNVPFSILVGAFLHEKSKNSDSKKGKMFERGKGGENTKGKVKDGKISLEDARKLRETDYSKWKEYNSKGLIDYNI